MRYGGEDGKHDYGFAIFDRPNKNLGQMIQHTNQIEGSDLTAKQTKFPKATDYGGFDNERFACDC